MTLGQAIVAPFRDLGYQLKSMWIDLKRDFKSYRKRKGGKWVQIEVRGPFGNITRFWARIRELKWYKVVRYVHVESY